MSDRSKGLSRRNFLLTLGAGGAAGAAAIVAPTVPRRGSHEPAQRRSAGYHESAHIRNYYRTAKV